MEQKEGFFSFSFLFSFFFFKSCKFLFINTLQIQKNVQRNTKKEKGEFKGRQFNTNFNMMQSWTFLNAPLEFIERHCKARVPTSVVCVSVNSHTYETCTSISWASPKYLLWTLQWGTIMHCHTNKHVWGHLWGDYKGWVSFQSIILWNEHNRTCFSCGHTTFLERSLQRSLE
jgi:hypothetical protein